MCGGVVLEKISLTFLLQMGYLQININVLSSWIQLQEPFSISSWQYFIIFHM